LTMVFVTEKIFSITQKILLITEKIFSITFTIVEEDIYLLIINNL
jgi:hypothetical protein